MMDRFGERLKKLRGDKKITQRQLAHDLNIPESTIRRLETQGGTPVKERITEIAIYFGVTTDYLLGKDDRDSADKLIEYLDVLELTNEEIYERMTFKVDDMTLSKEEVLEFIAFVRYQRSKKKQQSVSASKTE